MDSKKKAVLLTILAGFLWGTSFPAIKIGLKYMDAYSFVFLRFLAAWLIMLAVCLLTKNFSLKFEKKRLIFFLGVTNGIAYLLQYVGMVFVSASASSLFVNLSVVWVALLTPLLFRECLGLKKALGVMVSLLGVVFMTTNLDFSFESPEPITYINGNTTVSERTIRLKSNVANNIVKRVTVNRLGLVEIQ